MMQSYNMSDKCVSNEGNAYTEEPWEIIRSYFDGKHLDQLVRHQIESYNHFVNQQIKQTISMFNPIHVKSDKSFDPESGKYKLEIFVSFENFNIFRPQFHENTGAVRLMFPHEARLRDFTYACNMVIDMTVKYIIRSGVHLNSEETMYKTFSKIQLGKLPVMLKSCLCVLHQYSHVPSAMIGECSLDAGGYFIINGSEKTVIGQERSAENIIQCFNTEKNNTKWSWSAEIKSVPDNKSVSPKQNNIYIVTKNNGFGHAIYVQIPRIKQPIPLFILFRAFGIVSDKDICQKILLHVENPDCENYVQLLTALHASAVDANEYRTTKDALQYITSNVMYNTIYTDKDASHKKKSDYTVEVLNTDLFPHCNTLQHKIYFLGYMTNKLLRTSFGWEPISDRDSYLNKRIDLVGILLNNLFRNYFNKLVKDMQKQIVREINNGSWKSTFDYKSIINMTNIYKIVKSTTIENGIKRALSTGDFGIKQTNSNKVGVAQVLNRLTYIASLSHLRRVNTPIDKSGRLIPPRKLHNTSWGYLCPAETPEGHSVGVVKNLSYLTHITIPSNSDALNEYILPLVTPFELLTKEDWKGVKVFINGRWLGNTTNAMALYTSLKEKKYKGILNIYTSVVFDIQRKEIRVCNDAGRLIRPLLRVKDNKIHVTKFIMDGLMDKTICWDDLLTNMTLEQSVIEYIDPAEQNASLIAMKPKQLLQDDDYKVYNYTHCEIHPSTIFGILASCIPFPEHNQSPRNTYQCAMGKQAMGVYVTNYDKRMDKTAYVLSYPMRPLVDTRIMNLIKLNRLPSGCQVIVAIISHTGYNQEDSILFNEGSIKRGLFQTTIFTTIKEEDKKVQGDEEIRGKHDSSKTKGMKFANYDKVNEHGVIPDNTLVMNRDIIISKMSPIRDARNDHTKHIKYEDRSVMYRTSEESYVDKSVIDRNGDGYTFCKVRMRTVRQPIIGDKFSSRHGQKGTIGNIIPECDMPFTSKGLVPDIIINPHAIPSRMTIAQLKETLLGKVLLELGLFGDGTSFGDLDVKDICKHLQKAGYESNGNQRMYNGLTGELFETSVFIGPAFYQRLKHMVKDKMHSRSFGPKVTLTRQPAEGRRRDGGHRFGEMERDCMCSHGASSFTKDRMMFASDAFGTHVCRKCGTIAAYNDKKHIHLCKQCDNRTDFAYIELPYACKLLFQELITMNIAPRIMTV